MLLKLALLSGALLVTTVSAESWYEDPISGCKIWDDEDQDERDVIVSWSAGCDADGNAVGEGVLTWIEDGAIRLRYVGPLSGGKATGWGIAYVQAETGDGFVRYEGEFVDSEIDGAVTIDTRDGRRFVGRFDSVTRSGNGVASNTAGDRYTGEIANLQMHGEGFLERANGERYKGEFRANRMHGDGEWMSADGDYYVGQFVDGQMSGAGRLETADGRVYEGEFFQGLPHGAGVYTATDGSSIEGEFVRGFPDGEVITVTASGEVGRERWADGERVDD